MIGLAVPVCLAAQTATSSPAWQYGASVDVGYLHDSNYPTNHLFRSRGTTFHVNGVQLNMSTIYLMKPPADDSRWGMQLTLQAGKDAEVFGFSATAPNIGCYRVLRQLGPSNVSYLAPLGNGLTVQGGIFSSYVGYDGLYAKDNFNYTRPWGADFTPYFMLGLNAQYPFSSTVSGTLLVVNGYWHLAHANDVPSIGAQIAYKPAARLTVKHTGLFGPHQANTSLAFWRSLVDNTVEWRGDHLTVAVEYFVGTEEVDSTGQPHALWMSSQLPMRLSLSSHVSLALRPEVYWDRDGRTTLHRQTVKANTTTLEFRQPYGDANVTVRLEHRIDDSRGPDGGFFIGNSGLTPTQHLLIVAVLLTFDSRFRR
jgi:Putative beta-barrel porin-2, OmpL-like. bbp2